MNSEMSTFSRIPQEIIEHVAFHSATENFLGPPAGILPLLLLDRRVHTILSSATNHLLYARIFEYKFDLSPAIYRRWRDHTPVKALTAELQLRCKYLTRLRLDATEAVQSPGLSQDKDAVKTSLLIGYIMMTENKNKNERQLREWAQMIGWLEEYWFGPQGASSATLLIKRDRWPPDSEENSLAMWLFWFLLQPGSCLELVRNHRNISILKLMALGAHQYNLCSPSWIEFRPEAKHSRPTASSIVYPSYPNLTIPPLAPAAILSFLTVMNSLDLMSISAQGDIADPQAITAKFNISRGSNDWSGELERCLSIGRSSYDMSLTAAYTLGALQGVWEGVFTYTDFAAYAALVSGAPPSILCDSLVAQHRQTWKLREYHLLSGAGLNGEPLSAGNPLRAHLPDVMKLHEGPDGIEIQEPERNETLFYHKAKQTAGDDRYGSIVQDVIILGEGHSAWGQFNLIGRIRPCDGFVSLSKEYSDGDRGTWVYRGYLIGDANGNISGRWRDTMTPVELPGYEGCFAMSRRR